MSIIVVAATTRHSKLLSEALVVVFASWIAAIAMVEPSADVVERVT